MLVYPMNLSSLLRLAVFTLLAPLALAAPLRVLLITGGCCHDYAAQKELLKRGLEARANVVVEHLYTPDRRLVRRSRVSTIPTTPRASIS
jgi:hypothetical protein